MSKILDVKKLSLSIICLFLLVSFSSNAQKPMVQYDLEGLQKLKNELDSKAASAEVEKEYKRLLKQADKLLEIDNPTVIDKKIATPSKSKNDYLSISRYWWPDETKSNGLPWIRKDGETNPDTQTDAVDRKRLGLMSRSVETLSLAYFFSEDEKYAKKGISIINTWFIDKRTRMNPHLQYAQSVPGNPKSRRSGILDGRDIPVKVLDGITLISKSKFWKPEHTYGVDKWLVEYNIWLVSSDTGVKGSKQENNHGSWYNYQLAALAYYNGYTTMLEETIEKAKKMLDIQLDENGGQEHELKRTRSYFYSCFNLDAITRVAIIAEKAGMPFWNYTSEEGKGISKALNFLIPAANGEEWKYKTTKKGLESVYLAPVLKRVSGKIDNSEYDDTFKMIHNKVATKKSRKSKEKKVFRDYNFINQGLY